MATSWLASLAYFIHTCIFIYTSQNHSCIYNPVLPLTREASHLISDAALFSRLEVPEQALDRIPLDLGLV